MTADFWTAIGTVALAAATFVALAYTIYTTRADRRQAAADRRDAAQRLRDEREAGERRLRAERDHAEALRRRERQADSAQALLQRVAALQPYLEVIPGTWLRRNPPLGPVVRHQHDEECRAAIDTLRHGAWAETAMLGRGDAAAEAATRYRSLVKLVEDLARRHLEGPGGDRDVRALRNYARWVRISLAALAEDGAVPPIAGGSAAVPLPGLADHMPAWLPHPLPPGWTDDPDDDLEPLTLRPGTAELETGSPPETAGT